jgi:hypothetical protein
MMAEPLNTEEGNMPSDRTALLTIWPSSDALAGYPSQFEMWEHFRTVWFSVEDGTMAGRSVVTHPGRPLAAALAAHLDIGGILTEVTGLRLPKKDGRPMELSNRECHELYRLFEGRVATLLRFSGSCVKERELTCAGRAGFDIDLVERPSDALIDQGGWG